MNRFINKQRDFLTLFFASITLLMTIPALAVTPEEVTKLLASDGSIWDSFGGSVAISGDTAVIGAAYDRDPISNSQWGSVYVFVRNIDGVVCDPAEAWCEQARLTADDAFHRDRFGWWVDIDGDTLVVGSRQDEAPGADSNWNSGSAYVFTRSGTTWSQQEKLVASDAAYQDRFGTSVSISGDRLVIGAGEADGLYPDSGKAYVFKRTGTSWNEEAMLTAADQGDGALFGHYVSLAGDRLAITAHKDDAPDTDSGSAYLFVRNTEAVPCPETTTVDPWCQEQKLTASDGAAGHWYGGRVSLSSDTVLVGAPFADGINPGSGAAYVYTRSGTVWTEQAKLYSSDGETNDAFGFGAVISGDTAIVTSDQDNDVAEKAGSAYVFIRSGGIWTEQSPKLVASDAQALEYFGWNVDLAGDFAVLGAPRPFPSDTPGPGSAYIFDMKRSVTPEGDNVVVEPFPVDENGDPVEDAPPISLAFDAVLGAGDTTVTLTEEGPPPPGGFGVIGEAGSTYIELETTATFDGLVEVCIDYSNFTLSVAPINLAFAHYVDGEWVDITSSNDLENMILCGVTSSFSFFAIFAVEDPLAVLDGLDSAIAGLDAVEDVIESLSSKLNSARQKLTDDNPNNDLAAANVMVNAFVNAVEAHRGKEISDSDADALISGALAIATFVNP